MAQHFEGLDIEKLLEVFQESNPFGVGTVEILRTPEISNDVIEIFYNFDNVDPRMLVRKLKERFPEIGEIRIEYPAGSVGICRCYAVGVTPPEHKRLENKKRFKEIEEALEKLMDDVVIKNYNEKSAYRSAVVFEDVAKVEIYTNAPKLKNSDLYVIFSEINQYMKDKGYKFDTHKDDYGLYRWTYKK